MRRIIIFYDNYKNQIKKMFLLILNIIIININCVIKIPFKRYFPEKLTPENLMEQLNSNYISVNFSIGEPSQQIPFIFKMKANPIFVTKKDHPENIIKFDEKLSRTLNISRVYFQLDSDINGGYQSFDTFDLGNNIKINQFSFILADKLSEKAKKISGEIGLCYDTYGGYKIYETNFLEQLKLRKLVDSFVFGFEYNNEDEGNFIVGNYLHEYDNNYIEEDFIYIKLGIDKTKINWEIEFKNVIVNGTNIQDFNEGIEFNIEYGFILGTRIYYEKIKHIYFDLHNECKIQKFNKYFYYICDNNVNLKDFPVLEFNFFENKYNMSFNYNDLFYEFEGKKYFLIIFKEDFFNFKWTFGKPFFKKYFSFFDKEKKIFGFYQHKKKPIKSNRLLIFLLIIAIIISFILGYFMIKYYILLKNKRKIRANELEDNYEYMPQKITNPLINDN